MSAYGIAWIIYIALCAIVALVFVAVAWPRGPK